MFKDTKAFSGFSVDDLPKAMRFYSGTLGMDVAEKQGWFELRVAGGNPVMVYQKPNHAPATFTVLNFPVRDIRQTVAALTALGVRFESYTDPEIRTDENGITMGKPTMAWFKDPAGNILSVLENASLNA